MTFVNNNSIQTSELLKSIEKILKIECKTGFRSSED